MKAIELKEALVRQLAARDEIKGVGQTGSIDARLVPGQSDIDLFVLCAETPPREARMACYSALSAYGFTLQMEVCAGGLWGTGDVLCVDGVDVMPMYFTIDEMRAYLEEVLQCKRLDKDGRFYPVGRLASVSSIHILYEENGAWTALKNAVNRKPASFFKAWYGHEMAQVLDEEDLGRAALRREPLFYHQVLENALDHLLQALYALNDCYFPSRKRTEASIDGFPLKPEDCYARLLAMVTNGSADATIRQSIDELRRMAGEIREMGALRFGQSE